MEGMSGIMDWLLGRRGRHLSLGWVKLCLSWYIQNPDPLCTITKQLNAAILWPRPRNAAADRRYSTLYRVIHFLVSDTTISLIRTFHDNVFTPYEVELNQSDVKADYIVFLARWAQVMQAIAMPSASSRSRLDVQFVSWKSSVVTRRASTLRLGNGLR